MSIGKSKAQYVTDLKKIYHGISFFLSNRRKMDTKGKDAIKSIYFILFRFIFDQSNYMMLAFDVCDA